MKKFWENIKGHPIYSKVAAGLILAVLLAIFNKVFSWNIFSSIFDFANLEYTVPMWGLTVIAITSMALISVIIILISFFKSEPLKQDHTKQPLTETKPDWMSYTQDLIFDILWQWRYRWESIDSLRTDELIALCPKCKRELALDKTNATYRNSLSLICFNCDFEKNTNTRDFFNFKELVIREIQGRIRSGEYKDKIKQTV